MGAALTRLVPDFENGHLLVQLLLEGVQVFRHFFARLGLEPIVKQHGTLGPLLRLCEDAVTVSNTLLLLPHLESFSAALHQLERPAVHAHLSQVLLVVRIVQVMCLLVGVKVRFLVEALVAPRVGATEWFLASVDPQVGLEVEIQAEFLEAYIALVRLLPCVHQHVSLELSVVQEALITVGECALELKSIKLVQNLRVCRRELSCVFLGRRGHGKFLRNSPSDT